MAAIDNTTKVADTVKALDIEAITAYKQDHDRLMEILGIFGVETVPAGAALFRYKVTGELNTAEVGEGEETPLSKYKVERDPFSVADPRPFRRLITGVSILRGGYENSVLRGDRKMMTAMRNLVVDEFFEFLEGGTLTATGKSLPGALAQADCAIRNELESKDDTCEAIFHFVNRSDIADYLEDNPITLQTIYGMEYVKAYLGVENIFVTSRVPAGTVLATPVENIHVYGIDFATLSDAGLSYETDESGLIGVHHAPNYARNSCEVFALLGDTITAEIVNYIVKATFGDADQAEPKEPEAPESVNDKSTKAQLEAYAAAHGIDLTGCDTNAEKLAAIRAAEAEQDPGEGEGGGQGGGGQGGE